MLRVVEVVDLGSEVIRTSPYSFAITWPNSLGYPLYLRMGLASGSLLEVGMHFQTGCITEIELILAREVSDWPTDRPHIVARDIPEKFGTPVFFVEKDWFSDSDVLIFDSTEDFQVRVGHHSMAIDLGSPAQVVSRICSGRVNFGFDRYGFLHTIEIDNLTDAEMLNLRQLLQQR